VTGGGVEGVAGFSGSSFRQPAPAAIKTMAAKRIT
jgi:hypothetical protein